MAGVGPYGIEQVDVPGVLGAAQQYQGNRIRMMMEQKQLEMMDRQMAIQSSMAKAAQGFMSNFGGNASGSPSSGSAPDTSGTSTTPSGPSPSQAVSAMNAATPPPAVGPVTAANVVGQPAVAPNAGTMGSSLVLPPESYTSKAGPMLGTMAFLSPEQGQAMAGVLSKMDDAQLAQWKNKNQAIVGEFAGLLQLPYAQRKAAIQQNAADLQRLGYSPQQIAGFDPSDGNIRMEIGKHTDADHIAAMVNPTFENMRAGGTVAEIQPYGAAANVAQSPIVNGPHGSVYSTPPALNGLPVVQTPQDAAKLPPGSQFRLPDGRIGTVPGGAGGNASGGFQ